VASSTLEKDKRGRKDLSLIDLRPEYLKACERRSALNCCLRVRRRVFRARLYRQYNAAAFLSYPSKVPIKNRLPDTIPQLAPGLHQKISPGVVALLHLLERPHRDRHFFSVLVEHLGTLPLLHLLDHLTEVGRGRLPVVMELVDLLHRLGVLKIGLPHETEKIAR